MRSEGIDAAARELKRAVRAQDRFVAAMMNDFEAAEDAYDAFLTHAGRIYEKLRAAWSNRLNGCRLESIAST